MIISEFGYFCGDSKFWGDFFIFHVHSGSVQSAWSIKLEIKSKMFPQCNNSDISSEATKKLIRKRFFFSFSVYFPCSFLGEFLMFLKIFGVSRNNLWYWGDWKVIGLSLGRAAAKEGRTSVRPFSMSADLLTVPLLLSLPCKPALQLWYYDF